MPLKQEQLIQLAVLQRTVAYAKGRYDALVELMQKEYMYLNSLCAKEDYTLDPNTLALIKVEKPAQTNGPNKGTN